MKRVLVALALSAIISSCRTDPPPVAPTVSAVTVTAATATLNASATTALTATVTGTGVFDGNVTWSIVSGGGTLSATTGSSVTYSAPSAIPPSTTVVKATSTADSSKSASVTINVNSSTFGSSVADVTVTATTVALRESSSSTLQGAITGTGAFDPSLSWVIESGGIGTLSATTGSSVVYTAPSVSAGKVVRITASSVQDTTKKRTLFVSVNPVKGSLAAGGLHSLALTTDGTVLAWGDDNSGQLGDDTTLTSKTSPVFVSGLTNVVAIAAGAKHSLALLSNGTVYSWGNNVNGQLGNAMPLINSSVITQVQFYANVIAIAAAGNYSLLLTNNGQIYSWGIDDLGQLGNGAPTASYSVPNLVAGAQNNNVAIAASLTHAMALQADGTVLTWGDNRSGELGLGTAATEQTAPVQIPSLQNITAISAGGEYSLALKSDGTLLSWGNDATGQLGDNAPGTTQATPVSVLNASQIISIAGGGNHSLAVKSDGTVLAWGFNRYHQLGNGPTTARQATPVAIGNVTGIVAVSAGDNHSIALKADGTLLAWGLGFYGQLGIGGSLNGDDIDTPTAVLLGTNRIRVP